MIWDIIQQSSFSTYFSKPDLTLEELLVDENILTEMKNLNPQLLQYVNDHIDEIVTRLIEYVTVMPQLGQGQERCFKLPYVSSEMLAIESQIFYTIFFGKKGQTVPNNTKYLDILFHFLKTEAVNNELLLGYFQKVVTNLQKGRKLDLTVYISKNLHLFTQCLHLQTIGNLLKSCIILQNQKQGLLYEERKDILSELVHGFISPSNKIRQVQIRQVCLAALVDVLAKHKTFSSGDQIVGYLFGGCGEMLVMYGMVEVEEVTNFMAGIMAKSLQKIYNPELDIKQNIFKLPSTHKKLLIGYLPLRLHMIKFPKNQPSAPSPPIKQQNGQYVTKFPRQTLDYLTLLALTLQNEIDEFLLGLSKNSNENIENNQTFNQYFNFIWKCMKEHPKNDIALVQIVRIFLYVCAEGSDRSVNQKELRNKLIVGWDIVKKINQIFVDQVLERLLRPHLFQIWNKLRTWISGYIKDESNEWKDICTRYEKLVPLHSKASGLNYARPTNIKLVIDEQDLNQQTPNNPQPATLHNQQQNKDQLTNWRSPQTKQESATVEQVIEKQDEQDKRQEEWNNNQNVVIDKKYEITKQMQDWMENDHSHTQKKDSGIKQQFVFEVQNKNKGQFQQFGQFFTSDREKQDTKENKKGNKLNQFSAFDAFM